MHETGKVLIKIILSGSDSNHRLTNSWSIDIEKSAKDSSLIDFIDWPDQFIEI